MKLPWTLFDEAGSRALAGIGVIAFLAVVVAVVRCLSDDDRKVALGQEEQGRMPKAVHGAREQPAGDHSGDAAASQETSHRPPSAGNPRCPGDFLSDVHTALEEGEASHLVYLETGEMQTLFDRWSAATKTVGPGKGVTLFLMKREEDGTERNRISIEGTDITGIMSVKQLDGRWHVVGAETLDGKQLEEERTLNLWNALHTAR